MTVGSNWISHFWIWSATPKGLETKKYEISLARCRLTGFNDIKRVNMINNLEAHKVVHMHVSKNM